MTKAIKNDKTLSILFISQYFPPETGAAPERAFEFADYLQKQGHQLTVITGFPNHPTGIVHNGYKNKWFKRDDNYRGIKILRTYLYANPKKNFVNRMLNFLSFMMSSLVCSLFVWKIDAILLTIPPLFLGVTGVLYKLVKRKPLILDVRDLWPEAAIGLGEMKETILIKLLEKMELYFYKQANSITVVTDGIKKSLIKRNVVPEKIHLLTNGVNIDVFKKNTNTNNPYLTLELNNKFIVVYAGVIGIQHGTRFIAQAASIVYQKKLTLYLL